MSHLKPVNPEGRERGRREEEGGGEREEEKEGGREEGGEGEREGDRDKKWIHALHKY